MTQGDPVSQIVKFMIPMLIGNVFQQLYNTVDSIVVGKYVGDNALAAVGSAGPILNLLLVLFMGISVGAGIMVSQYFGARQRKALSMTIGTCITMTFIASLIVMAIAPLVTMPLLKLLNTPAEIIDWCDGYLMTIFLGIAGCAFYNILGGMLRGLGDSVSALLYLVIATILNIFLDIYFVAKLGMGVQGVALATVIAQSFSAVLAFLKLRRRTDCFDMKAAYLKPTRKYLSELVRLGLPSGVTQAIFSLSMVIVQSLTNSFGPMCIATNVIVMRIDGFVMMPAFSFGAAMTTFAGQNYGAGKFSRLRSCMWQSILMTASFTVFASVFFLIFGRFCYTLFTNEPEVIDDGMKILKFLVPFWATYISIEILSGVIRGVGDSFIPMMISLFGICFLRIAWLFIAVPHSHTILTVLSSYPLTWTVTSIAFWIYWFSGKWIHRK